MIQQTYWIISGRDVVRQYVKRCLVCFRHRAKACNQKMSDLPAARVIPTRPFQRCGVDFAGPFTLRRTIGGRSNQTCKSYVCVFVCFVTRAIHLELVSDLTSDSFMASFKRFIARRGLCSDIYSDCGTNFVGADTEIKRIYEFVQSADSGQRIQQFLSARSVKWHFNPPSSPHFGGLWESGVRVVKGHLRRVIGTTSLNFEEYATLLAQVESCVNSRPLAPLSCNPEDLSALTPGHFLIGAPLNALPEHDLTDIKLNRLSRWQHCQQLAQHFWRRWHNEYLHQLQQRHKWNSVSENLAVGTMVLMKDERLSPTEWKLGRILHTHPGPDGLVRVVTVKTSGGELKRPIVKLCPLPFDQPSSASSSSSFE
ncbi:unnamed protein product [Allacma fusca]|uniref:Integrase catalytic domain-containing protein n=1 Tax=Allacma fusca TaxID=39272 RepID=A0A8J2KG04_9HEXA|nr:unnamed protein product [Allacma fusca]